MQALSLVRVATRSLGSKADLLRSTGALCRCPVASVCSPQTNQGITDQIKRFQSTRTTQVTLVPEDDRGFISKNWEKFKFRFYKKYVLKTWGWMLYRDSVDRLDYIGFFKEFRMADTYFSWFLVTELHVWMLMVRLMAQEIEGNECRKLVVEAMWEDARQRKKQLGHVKEMIVRDHMTQMGHQFNAALMGYDEGLLTDDKVLAGAIWRRFLQSECNNPEVVEQLVIYIRKTMVMLDKIPYEDLIRKRAITWLDYKKCRPSNSV